MDYFVGMTWMTVLKGVGLGLIFILFHEVNKPLSGDFWQVFEKKKDDD